MPNKPQSLRCDLAIIGGGAAGLSVAAGAAQLGKKVVLFEQGEMGGDCLNVGCVPSKALIAAANACYTASEVADFGINAGEVGSVNWPAVKDHIQGVIETIAPIDSQERFENLGVTVIRETARFIGPKKLSSQNMEVSARKIVIATGSVPNIPPIPLTKAPYLTNETIFSAAEFPEKLLILGGGIIGCELGQAFARLGSEVTIIEQNALLGSSDPDAVQLLRQEMSNDGITLLEGWCAENVRAETAQSPVEVTIKAETGQMKTISGSHLLVALGRRGVHEQLDLEQAGIDPLQPRLAVDQRLRAIGNKQVYVIGDAHGQTPFTHMAGNDAALLVRNALFKLPINARDIILPSAIFTSPELAQIGVRESEMQAGWRCEKLEFTENDRAQCEGDTGGFAKLITDKKGKIKGATMVGKNAGDLIQIIAMVIYNDLSVRALTNLISPYPTRGEIAKRLGGAYYSGALFSSKTRLLVRLLSWLPG